MAKETNKEITSPVNTSVGSSLPSFMGAYSGAGMENIGMEDMEIPRVKLLQMISDEVQERDDCKAGEFYHTIAELPMGKELKVVPIMIWNSAILWRPRHDGGGIIARADDGKNWTPARGEYTIKPSKDSNRTVVWKLAPTVAESGLTEWGSYDPENQDSQPAATKMINILAFFPDYPEFSPSVLTLQRASIKVGRKLLAKLKLSSAPIFGTIFNMSSFKDTNQVGQDFYNYRFDAAGFVQTEQEFGAYLAMHNRFTQSGVKIKDIDGLQDDVYEGEEAPESEAMKGKNF